MITSNSIRLECGAVDLVAPGTPRPPVKPTVMKIADAERLKREALAELESRMQARLQQDRGEWTARCGECRSQFEQFFQSMKLDISREVVGMAVRIAEIIVRHQLPDREMLMDLVQRTLDPVSDLHGARVRVHPSEVKAMREGDSGAIAPLLASDKIEVVPDAALAVGDMVIESRNGIFDARLDERLKLLGESLTQRCVRHGGDAKT